MRNAGYVGFVSTLFALEIMWLSASEPPRMLPRQSFDPRRIWKTHSPQSYATNHTRYQVGGLAADHPVTARDEGRRDARRSQCPAADSSSSSYRELYRRERRARARRAAMRCDACIACVRAASRRQRAHDTVAAAARAGGAGAMRR